MTTKEGERNTWKQLKLDVRLLRCYLKKAGLDFEDCLVCEETPGKGLLHLHGFFRVEGGIDSKLLHEVLSIYWEAIHHAPVVWVEDIFWVKGMIDYDVKHALKNYLGYNGESYEADGLVSRRILRSKGWLPLGWKEALKVFVKWALTKRDWWDDESEGDVISLLEYVPFKWEVMKEMVWRWCNGEEVLVDFSERYYLVHGNKIIEMECEVDAI